MSNFVDYVKIHCTSGHGGAGSAHLRREKYIPKGGPDGGDGLLWIAKAECLKRGKSGGIAFVAR